MQVVTHSQTEDTPVVTSGGRLVGILGKNDLLIALSQAGKTPPAAVQKPEKG